MSHNKLEHYKKTKPNKLAKTVAITSLFLIGFASYFSFDFLKNHDPLMEAKTVRTGVAIVKNKEYIYFSKNITYKDSDLGFKVYKKIGDEEWRVYFQIIDFEDIDDQTSSKLLQLESQRLLDNNLRFWWNDRNLYEKSNINDKLLIGYQWLGGKDIMVIWVKNSTI